MKVKNSTMQAFPFIEPHEDDNIKAYHPGISLRDYFAAKAMQGFLVTVRVGCPDDLIATDAYNLADAMMKARK